MSFLSIPRTYGNIRRATQIAVILTRHGFGHLIGQLRISDSIPGLSKLRLAIKREGAGAPLEVPTPKRLAQLFEELGPTFIKLGQLLATRPDLIPPAYVEELTRLQDKVEPFAPELAIAKIEKAFHGQLDDFFSNFEDTPVASGSIGQVHRAKLKDGSPVVVKVKRPNSDSRIREDLDIILWLADRMEKHLPEIRPMRPKNICEEFSRCIRRELDFVSEASYTAKFADNFKDDDSIVIPRVHWDLVSHDVMVVEEITGTPFSNFGALPSLPAERKRLADSLGTIFMHQFFISGLFHADPHPGNIFLLADGRIALLDFGQVGHVSLELRQQLAMSLMAISSGDFDTVADIYAEIGDIDEIADMRRFRSEMADLIDRYYGVPIEKMDLAQLFEELISLTRNHGLMLPRNLVLLGKSIVTVVSVAQQLDPGFRIDKVAQPFIKRIFRKHFDPRDMIKNSPFSIYHFLSDLKRLPRDMKEILKKVRTGRLRVIFHHEALEDLAARIDHSSSRLSLAMVLAAIIVGSALILSGSGLGTSALPLLGETRLAYLLAIIGFGLAVITGFVLIWSIIRSNKK
ncbi:MAG: hypothetical protein JXA52_05415 [Planctomycetes bacterium]|nr:hypothetical protein [Planctomycetota bacterium]